LAASHTEDVLRTGVQRRFGGKAEPGPATRPRSVVLASFGLLVAVLTVGCPSSQRVPVGTSNSESARYPMSVEPADSETAELPFLFSATFTTGGSCSTPCNGELQIAASNSGGDTFLTLFSYSSSGDPTPVGSTGVLSAKSREYLHSLLETLSSAGLETHYPGCGAGCDGWNVLLRYSVPGHPTIQTLYTRDGLGETPQVVQALDSFVQSLVLDLSKCQGATERVTLVPARDCIAGS
jgi:hypothetical protein